MKKLWHSGMTTSPATKGDQDSGESSFDSTEGSLVAGDTSGGSGGFDGNGC